MTLVAHRRNAAIGEPAAPRVVGTDRSCEASLRARSETTLAAASGNWAPIDSTIPSEFRLRNAAPWTFRSPLAMQDQCADPGSDRDQSQPPRPDPANRLGEDRDRQQYGHGSDGGERVGDVLGCPGATVQQSSSERLDSLNGGVELTPPQESSW